MERRGRKREGWIGGGGVKEGGRVEEQEVRVKEGEGIRYQLEDGGDLKKQNTEECKEECCMCVSVCMCVCVCVLCV
jgi:hypothetical protein